MYGDFSQLYDQLIYDIDYDAYAQLILGELAALGFEGGRLLEVGCGTGNLTARLAPEVNVLYGIDLSQDMLNVAWAKLADRPNVQLSLQDMRKMQVPQVEGCVSTLDTFNYVDEAGLKATFERVALSLGPGGAFVFDINSAYRLLEEIGGGDWIFEKDNVFYCWESEREGNRVESWLTFFVEGEDGRYDRIDEEQVQWYHGPEKVEQLLAEAGFSVQSIKDFDGGGLVNEKTRRILFSCQKTKGCSQS